MPILHRDAEERPQSSRSKRKRGKRGAFVERSRTNMSRVSNGKTLFLPGVDGRSAPARRCRDIAAAIASDLGGVDQLSEAEKQLVRRATLISVECERMETESVAGKSIDLDLFGKLTDRLGRTLQRIGLKRVPRDVTPTLQQYLAAKQ